MLAHAYRDSLSSDALPVCLGNGNPNRLVSLLDIVNEFRLTDFASLMLVLGTLENGLFGIISSGRGGQVSDLPNAETKEAVSDAWKFSKSVGFSEASVTCSVCLHRLNEAADASTLASELRHIRDSLLLESDRRKFIFVGADRADYIDRPDLFGQSVNTAFPSAIADIKGAGNCLATECSTASVFHLMRAAEIALRALAADRRVECIDTPIESREWGDLLGALDGRLKELRLSDGKRWPSKDVKEAQLKFYHSAVAEFRGFNDAWRKHVAHARDFYDRDHALSILNHTKRFMT
jgi:hypothetical protein